jgi:hypothetical protein
MSSSSPRLRRRRTIRAFAERLEHRTLLAMTSPSVLEGAPGTTTTASFTITYRMGPESELNVRYQTANGTALAGVDYNSTVGEFFLMGPAVGFVNRSHTVDVTVRGDAVMEGDETFSLELFDALTGDFLDRATATIRNDDINNAPIITSFTDTPDPSRHGDTLTLTAEASDPDGNLASVSFFRESDGTPGLSPGDQLLGGDNTAPYQLLVPLSIAAVGTRTYYARAVDGPGFFSTVASTTNTLVNTAPTIRSFTDSPDPCCRLRTSR